MATETTNMFSLLEDGAKAPAPAKSEPVGGFTKPTPGSQRSQNGGNRGEGNRRGGGRGGRGGSRGGRGREYDRRSGTGRGNKLGYENKKGGGGRGNWGAPGDDGSYAPTAEKGENDAAAEEPEEPDNELTLDEYAKQQAEAKKKLEALTGKSSGATVVDASKEFKGMSMNKKEDVTSEWAAFESGSKKGRTKNRKEKQTLTAGFKIKDEGYEPRERRDRGGRGGARGGRGGRGGARGGGRGGMNAKLDSASDFPTLG
ncbi:HABP4_PAI-RBP1 domain-containing protein [Chloropicon roscoffensis]|uniref:HABP4_PAI-RBP1 domain-containing protein n=1 Tax=Chloropicon roscoffensis TaxID=1461544 RepID=A0A7S3FN49_9CHLO|mmetsp:Transcript_2074/g.6411  ORF Transcript_2074/g.6411 Transcript_2074/m.6411 type:complete len:257 (+) Transcript_2074:142-912(+)